MSQLRGNFDNISPDLSRNRSEQIASSSKTVIGRFAETAFCHKRMWEREHPSDPGKYVRSSLIIRSSISFRLSTCLPSIAETRITPLRSELRIQNLRNLSTLRSRFIK